MNPGSLGEIVDHAAVAMQRDGRFFVVWMAEGQEPREPNPESLHEGACSNTKGRRDTLPLAEDIRGRLFFGDGSPIAPAFVVSEPSPLTQNLPAIAADGTGLFVVAWNEGDRHAGYQVMLRWFDAVGQPLTPPIPADDRLSTQETFPDLAMTAAGNAVVVWSVAEAGRQHHYARAFTPQGAPLWEARRLNRLETNDPAAFGLPSVSVSPGGWAVAVWGHTERKRGSAIAVKDFPVAGGPSPRPSRETLIDRLPDDGVRTQRPDVSMNARAEFVVCWLRRGRGGGDDQVMIQRFDRFARPEGDPVEIDPDGTRQKERGVIQLFLDGSLVVLYSGRFPLPACWDVVMTGLGPNNTVDIPPFLLHPTRRVDRQSRPAMAVDRETGLARGVVTWESKGQATEGNTSIRAAFIELWTR